MGYLPSERENGHHFSKEAPLETLMSSLQSAKDFIVPMVSSSLVSTMGSCNLIFRMPSTGSAVISGENSDIFQGSTQGENVQPIAKENRALQMDKTSSKLGQHQQHCLSDCFECLSSLWSHDELIHATSFHNCSDREKFHKAGTYQEGSEKQLSGLSVQGLSTSVPAFYYVMKPNRSVQKIRNSFRVPHTEDSCVSQKPAPSVFQTMMEHCIFASSTFSKHVGQVIPWNENIVYSINDSKNRMMGYLSNTISISMMIDRNHILGKLQEQVKYHKSLGFARVGGDPNTSMPPTTTGTERSLEPEESSNTTPGGVFKMPIPNIERLRSTLSTVSLSELIEFVPQLGKTSQDFPDKKKLFSVQDFFRYTEAEGRRFFEELDRDHDGQVTLEDLEVVMRKRRLPQQYAREFLRRTRKHLFAKSFGWKEFHSLMEQKEPMLLRSYNSLSLSKSGTLQKNQVLLSLRNAGLPATEENAEAMMRCLDPDARGCIAYGQFRNFMLLLPPERLGDDPRMVWFEAATVFPMAPPVAVPAENVLKSALAGGLACALSTSLMHPIDTMKTRVQASSTLSFAELISKLPEIGIRGLYRGSLPAIWGQFSSHGLRTGIFEASKLLLTNLAPDLPELQVQSLSSFCSTILGTAVRIPCEVLKQRLQAGLFDNVGDALIGTWKQDGPQGFFRGTGATLCREVPFYVAGMAIYEEAKKAMQRILKRELFPWETIAVGAISGGLAAVCTTPFDVMKTRTMTATPGTSTKMSQIALTIIQEQGLLGLFKGAVPRFFWIAPLGAMNFAGYELAKRAMEKDE